MRHIRTLLAIACLAVVALAPAAEAQRGPNADDRYSDRPAGSRGRNTAGEFDYLVLVLSWSPTHCASLSSNAYDPQCHRRDGRRYNFVLHGLWPQYERGYPEFCSIGRRPYVPQPLIDSMQDIMPSTGLTIHEYKKHGTCTGLDPFGYYALARRLFNSIKVPDRYVNPFEAQFVTPDDLIGEFLRENPQLTPDQIAISCGGAGNRLRDVRVCFGKDGSPRGCGDNETSRKLCSGRQMFVPPVRSTFRGPDTAPGSDGSGHRDNPLPGPRLIPSPRTL